MKIRQDESKQTTFKDIVPGTAFTRIDTNKYYMKTCYWHGINAVCLTDNTYTSVENDERIAVIDCELVIK